jgi:ATP-dependent DNA helicase PIF1
VPIGGVTIHSFAGVGRADKAVEDVSKSAIKRWQACDCLVVDEVSMLDAALLDKVDAIARYARGRDKPFGGVQVVFIGDFLQLPPVSKSAARSSSGYAFESAVWREAVRHVVVLTTVFRQSDSTFVAALNNIRKGIVPSTTKLLLESRLVSRAGTPPADAIVLCPRNNIACSINSFRLGKLPGQTVEYKARRLASRDTPQGVLEGLWKQLDSGCLAPALLELKVDAAVVLLTNLQPARGLVNGTRGIVESLDPEKGPTVRFFPHRSSGSSSEGVLLTLERESFRASDGEFAWVARSQFPIRLSYALSIHKSQGMTLDRLAVQCSGIWEAGQAYVALSRARSLDGLWLLDEVDFQSHIKADDKISRFDQSLQDLSDRLIAAMSPPRPERPTKRSRESSHAAPLPKRTVPTVDVVSAHEKRELEAIAQERWGMRRWGKAQPAASVSLSSIALAIASRARKAPENAAAPKVPPTARAADVDLDAVFADLL